MCVIAIGREATQPVDLLAILLIQGAGVRPLVIHLIGVEAGLTPLDTGPIHVLTPGMIDHLMTATTEEIIVTVPTLLMIDTTEGVIGPTLPMIVTTADGTVPTLLMIDTTKGMIVPTLRMIVTVTPNIRFEENGYQMSHSVKGCLTLLLII